MPENIPGNYQTRKIHSWSNPKHENYHIKEKRKLSTWTLLTIEKPLVQSLITFESSFIESSAYRRYADDVLSEWIETWPTHSENSSEKWKLKREKWIVSENSSENWKVNSQWKFKTWRLWLMQRILTTETPSATEKKNIYLWKQKKTEERESHRGTSGKVISVSIKLKVYNLSWIRINNNTNTNTEFKHLSSGVSIDFHILPANAHKKES